MSQNDQTACEDGLPRAPRGRPTAARAREIKNAIISVATDAFLGLGFDQTSMDLIAARACVPKSTIYKSYPDKTALLREVIRQRVECWSVTSSGDDWKLSTDLEQRLTHHIRQILTFSLLPEVQAIRQLTRHAWGTTSEQIEAAAEASGLNAALRLLESDIRHFGPMQQLTCEDPKFTAQMMIYTISGWLAAQSLERGVPALEKDDFAKRLVRATLNGCCFQQQIAD